MSEYLIVAGAVFALALAASVAFQRSEPIHWTPDDAGGLLLSLLVVSIVWPAVVIVGGVFLVGRVVAWALNRVGAQP